ncbi:tumor suppressor, Mitostatin-domain-containing protein [Powellomyces hirtus]|nr:tumor suppressor, Mitostatin-domain-containing protein [Powellomyces hirtus]
MSKVASYSPQLGGREKKIVVVTRDNIRTLKPHPANMSRELGPPGQVGFREAIVMSKGELERVKAELDRHTAELNRHRIAAAEASRARKAKMEAYDHTRATNAKLSVLEAEAKAKSTYLLAKAQLQLEEQEDEIKHMNELMLYAKCVAIRDKQVEEKKVIKNDRKQEEARLDAMMEAVRVDELKKLEDREKKRIEEMRKGAATIRSQITDRREAALLEAERRDQETKLIIQQMEARNAQDLADKAAKIQVQKKLRQQVVLANQESLERKRLAKKEEEEEDRKVLEYIIEKEKRETENDRIAKEKKAEPQQDALRAQRAFEAHEREYRQKLLLQTERNLANEKALRESRATQQRARQHAIAVEAHKMREEFMENLERQKEQEVKIREDERTRAERNREYASKVKAQISEKEQIRKKQREEFFMEGIRLAKERNDKAQKIEQIKERKLQELASLGIPTKYCKEVERKVHVPLDRNMFSMARK